MNMMGLLLKKRLEGKEEDCLMKNLLIASVAVRDAPAAVTALSVTVTV